jgi:hypothetical protein
MAMPGLNEVHAQILGFQVVFVFPDEHLGFHFTASVWARERGPDFGLVITSQFRHWKRHAVQPSSRGSLARWLRGTALG